jgi:serine/threonine protein kinase
MVKLFLSVEDGPARGKTFEIPSQESLRIGRSADTDTQIDDPRMSRKHCSLTQQADGSLQLTDLGSSSGTQYEGENVESVNVWAGAQFRAGDSVFLILTDEELKSRQQGTKIKGENDLGQLVGQELAGYQLESVIGKGSTGLVFKSTAIQTGDTVAVKVLYPRFATNDQSRERFVRAMKTMLPIKAPNIIEIYGAGKRGPFCWFAMKYIDGQSLSEVIDKIGITGMLKWEDVWKIAVDIARALKAGFRHQIIHRNLTPNNVIRRESDKTSFLGDFILAKAIDDTVAQQITRPGQLVGELGYMSPERTLENGVVDTRSDLYGLGATCYALLTGQPPATGDTLPETLLSIREETPKPPKEFQLSVNEMFQNVIMKLLSKNPEDRFNNPELLLQELERVGKYNSLKLGV